MKGFVPQKQVIWTKTIMTRINLRAITFSQEIPIREIFS
jgi:hypothetical protein